MSARAVILLGPAPHGPRQKEEELLGDRFPFGLPNGWYVVAASDELKPGGVLSRHYFDREIAIFRTRSGAVSVVDAHCPHMGAHLGKVGRVDGEVLRCGFHGFRYDRAGKCVATGDGGPPPARARLKTWEVHEQNGLILTWFDPEGRPPQFQVPASDGRGWSSVRWKRFRIATHPQETTENSIDFGHFTQLHGFIEGTITQPIRTDGPYLQSSYRALRPYGLPGREPVVKMPVEYHVQVWGLGYSLVDVDVGLFGLKLRVWILPVPIDDENIDLIVGLAAQTRNGPLTRLVRFIAHRIVYKEVEQDLDVWTYKAFVDPPALAKGDGPVVAYRQWAQQFYPAD